MKAIQTKVCIAFVFLGGLNRIRMKELVIIDSFEKVLDKKLRVRHLKKVSGESKPTIVFLHEGLGSIDLWKDFPSLVADKTGYNVVIYERQGYGASSPLNLPRPLNYLEIEATEYLPKLLQQLEIKRPILVGHSDGGTIALIYAALYPVSMVLTAAAHVLVEEVTIEGIELAVKHYDKNNIGKKLEKYHGDKAHDLFWAWADTWLDSAFRNWDISHFLPKIDCPTLLIQGQDDEYATLDQLNLISEEIGGNAESLVLENCAHSPHIQAKSNFLEAVCTFIKIHEFNL